MSDLKTFVFSSPLLKTCGLTRENVEEEWNTWIELGDVLIEELRFSADSLTERQKERIYQYYLPVFFWVLNQQRHHCKHNSGALVVGVSAPQGCGKTSLVHELCTLLERVGLNAAAVSIDDFYLTYEDQSRLRDMHPNNPLVQMRGNAGTHDVDLGSRVLKELKALGGGQEKDQVLIPRYDKSAYEGRGDRFPQSQWHHVSGPLHVVLLEGWMLGFQPVDSDAALAVHPGLGLVNALLGQYASAWDALVDAWLVIKVKDPNWVFEWRLEAEEAMKRSGRPGMTKEQVRDFVDRFMPAYRAYLPDFYRRIHSVIDAASGAREGAGGKATTDAEAIAVVELNESRRPVAGEGVSR